MKHVLLAAERRTRRGWVHRPEFKYRTTNDYLAQLFDRLGEPKAPGASPGLLALSTELGGLPARFRLVLLPVLLGVPWNAAELQTIYVTAEDLEDAQRGRLPAHWQKSPEAPDYVLPVPFPLTPRHCTGSFSTVVLPQLKALVGDTISDFDELRVAAALVS